MDINYISHILIIDDNSPADQINEMIKFLKDFNVNIKIIHRKIRGHYISMNMIFDEVKTEYIFHLEDDWLLTKEAPLIKIGLDKMRKNEKIKSVLYRRWVSYKDGVHYWNGKKYNNEDIMTYPGYTFNPTLQNIKAIHQEIGHFKNVPFFELAYSYRYAEKFVVGMTEDDYFEHLGHGKSAYEINRSKR